MSLPKEFNGEYYDESYFWEASKGYRKKDGSFATFGYLKEQDWKGWITLAKWLRNNLKIKSLLDVGCGTGGFVKACLNEKIDVYGMDYSRWAIKHSIAPKDRVWIGNAIEKLDYIGKKFFDLVCGIDLLEHVYEEDLDRIIKNMKETSSKWLLFKICTAQKGDEVKAFKRGEEISREWEWLAISGHVCSKMPEFWRNKLENKHWKIHDELSDKLIIDLQLGEDWRCSLILKKR